MLKLLELVIEPEFRVESYLHQSDFFQTFISQPWIIHFENLEFKMESRQKSTLIFFKATILLSSVSAL